MRERLRLDVAARVLLTVAALLPYWQLLTFSVVYVTDDYFASDIFNGELPGRALIGQLIRSGQLPVWTNQLCSGLSLAGSAADPIGLSSFVLLPPGPALDLFVIVLLLVAAHGAYGLARRFGADRMGAVLAGIAFAGSGYIACQLKHLSIVSTIVWLPVGLLLIDRALAVDPAADARPPTLARRALYLAAFGLVFAEQVLSGFPQSAYICALFYGAFALFCAGGRHWPARAIGDRTRIGSLPLSLALLAGLGLATALGAAAGAVVLLPLSELGSVSDRSEPLGYLWSTALAYWPPNILTFLVPDINGDISDNSFIGPPFFWEDYGYVGLATVLLAFYGAVRERRRPLVVFAIVMTLVAYFLVLGRATPVYRVAYELLPGLKLFRFPTRFLIVVELGLALLGAVGLTRLRADMARRWPSPSRVPQAIALVLCAGTALDLFIHQPRQNPMVPAQPWLAPPPAVPLIQAATSQPRTFTPRHRELHRRAFQTARGWTDVGPYFEVRHLLEPNTGGGFWGTPSADCYAGIAPRWYVDVWGDHSREAALVALLAGYDHDTKILQLHPAFANLLKMYGVSHVLSPYPQQGTMLQLAGYDGQAYVYTVAGTSRVRFVRAARHVTTDQETARRLLDSSFDPDREILLNDAPDTIHPTVDEIDLSAGDAPMAAAGRAVITSEDSRQIVIDAEAPDNGFLLLADTFYPGWAATVDGSPTPIYRANHAVRGIQLPRGRHEVRFTYEAPGYIRGLQITLLSVSILLLWAGVARLTRTAARRAASAP